MATDKQLGGRGNVWGLIRETTDLVNINGISGLGLARWAKMSFNFTYDGGAIATITPRNSPVIPAGAIILGGVTDIVTGLTSAGAATIALGFGSGAEKAVLLSATAIASYDAGLDLAIVPVFTGATYYKVLTAARMTLTVAAFVLTAGVMDVNIVYVQGNV